MIPRTQRGDFLCGKPITLVEDHDPWNGIHVQRLKDAVDRLDLLINIHCGGIHHVEQQVGITEFVQGRAKGTHQVLGKVPDKSDGIGHDDFPVVREAQAATGGIERLKELSCAGISL